LKQENFVVVENKAIKRVLLTAYLFVFVGHSLSAYSILKLMVEKIPVKVNIIALPISFILFTISSILLLYYAKLVWKDK